MFKKVCWKKKWLTLKLQHPKQQKLLEPGSYQHQTDALASYWCWTDLGLSSFWCLGYVCRLIMWMTVILLLKSWCSKKPADKKTLLLTLKLQHPKQQELLGPGSYQHQTDALASYWCWADLGLSGFWCLGYVSRLNLCSGDWNISSRILFFLYTFAIYLIIGVYWVYRCWKLT